MSRYQGIDKSVHERSLKTGILLTNLGTPEAPTESALRTYLRQFLSDPRVVEIPRLVWMIILHGIILRVRPAKSAKLYKSIWTEQGSPLMAISLEQVAKVREKISQQYGDKVIVDLAMRYGNPAIGDALKNFQKQGVNNIIVLPLYPQYAGPTTGSTFDALVKEVQAWRWIPNIHFLSSYHDHPLYIQALTNSIQEYIDEYGKPDKLVISYHGMPKLFHTQGDPYFCFCAKTTRLVVESLGLDDNDYVMTFQSRFGKAEWLQPYTDATLESLPGQGAKNIAIISPAFSADCLETLEELESENREIFMEAGGESYRYIPALNVRDDHIIAITSILEKELN